MIKSTDHLTAPKPPVSHLRPKPVFFGSNGSNDSNGANHIFLLQVLLAGSASFLRLTAIGLFATM